MTRRWRSGVAAVIAMVAIPVGAVAAPALSAVSAAPADVGVGITAEPITLGHSVAAGGSYAMGPVTVVNTGTERGTVRLRLADEPAGDAQPVAASWVSFERDSVPLGAGKRAAIAIKLTPPDDAPAGEYRSLLFASITKPREAGTNGIGAEAATELTFTVGDDSEPGSRATSEYVALALVVAVVALVSARFLSARRYRPRHLYKSNV